ncbi:hypothetical protein TNCV_4170731 [Trichonephila clavipes]|nr:hypothetical protein TNCV_4170731 [Trichonephila clavipes]
MRCLRATSEPPALIYQIRHEWTGVVVSKHRRSCNAHLDHRLNVTLSHSSLMHPAMFEVGSHTSATSGITTGYSPEIR